MPFDIVLVDDHKLVRDGVRTILERGAEKLLSFTMLKVPAK